MNENVKKVLMENIWSVATCGDGPNVVPVGFKMVGDDDKLIIGDVLMETTMNNVKANGKIAISAFSPETSEGYQVKGTAEYFSEGPLVEKLQAIAQEKFGGKLSNKGALVITPEKIIVTSPGPDNKKEL